MQDTVTRFVNEKQNGLMLFEMPTGSGKTYQARKIIGKYIKGEILQNIPTIFYVSPLIKNVDDIYSELREDFQDDLETFDASVLRLYPNAECVVKYLRDIENRIPFSITNKQSFKELKQQVDLYNQVSSRGTIRNSTTEAYLNNIRKTYEPPFRRDLVRELEKNCRTKRERKKKLQSKEYSWVKELYPSCMTDDRKVIIMTMSKFIAVNDPIIDKAYRFISYSKTKGALVFLDEFDATKAVVLNQEIERCKDYKFNLVKLFQQLSGNLKNMKDPMSILVGSKDPADKTSPLYAYTQMKKVIFETQEEHNLDYRFKLESNEERDKCFLFDDFSLHTISTSDKNKRISIHTDNKTNHITISFVANDETGNFNRLMQQLKGAINYFIKCCAMISRDYLNDYNDKHKDEKMNIEQAVSTVLDQFNLDENINRTLIPIIVNDMSIPVESRHRDIMKTDFYLDGFKYYDFEDDIVHNETTSINMCYFENTPEKFLLSLTNIARVVGLSATATVESVLANYDLNYIKKKLGNNYHELTSNEKQRIKKKALERMGGEYAINVEQIACDYDKSEADLTTLVNQVFTSKKAREKVCGIIGKYIDDGEENKFYDIARFLKTMQAVKCFISNKHAKALLVMTNRNIIINDDWHVFSLNVAEEVIAVIAEECGERKPEIHYLQGEDFQNQKENYLRSMSIGEKVVLFTCYNTAGSGQNLQYEYNDEIKDIDSIYIEMPTNALVHEKYLNEESNLIKYIYQQEVLKKDGGVPPIKIMGNIVSAFKQWSAPHKSLYFHKEVYYTSSVNNHHVRTLIQAVGRLCRTPDKQCDVNIYVDSDIYDKIDFSFLTEKDVFLNREFEELIKQNKKSDKNNERMVKINRALDANERNLSRISNILSENKQSWRDEDIKQWKAIRDFVLRYPTISYENLIKAKSTYSLDSLDDFYLYAQDGEKINKFYYTVDGDNCTGIFYELKTVGKALEASAEMSRLSALMRIPELKSRFIERGYVVDFDKNDGVLLPSIFQNIYKGALGEVAGQIMLENWGWKLNEIEDSLKFEKFDFCLKLAPDIYIDFKNWTDKADSENYRNQLVAKSREKLISINGKKVFIINMVADEFVIHDKNNVVTVSTIFRKQGAYLYKLDNPNINKLVAKIKEAVDESNN